MKLLDAQILVAEHIAGNITHRDYDHVVELAKNYKRIITGSDIEALLVQFVRREDKEMFAQRVRITQSVTPAGAAAVRMPFAKATRNDKVTRVIDIKDETKKKIVEDMIAGFYGSRRKKNSGLDGFMQSKFNDLTFTDPNAWVVVEWEGVAANKQVRPRPYIVSAEAALDFSVVNDEIEWLFVGAKKTFLRFAGMDGDKPKTEKAEGVKYTLYDADYTVVFDEVDKNYIERVRGVFDGEELIKVDTRYFLFTYYTPNLGFAPAFRIGYERDLNTDGRTFVNPFEPAMPFFMKTIKAVSELDLTMALHTFPQKIQYVQRCGGESRELRCLEGYLPDGSICGACGGTGQKLHTTAQDVILLRMPEDPKEIIDLNNLIAYKSPPTELVKLQIDYVNELRNSVVQAVFNSDVFTRGKLVKTATEKNIEMESVYDKLTPFADKYSELWVDIVSVCAILAALNLSEINIVHAFPIDLKLKTVPMLLGELQAANESKAPTFLRDGISKDIAAAMYADDPMALLKYEVKHRFFPFNGKNDEEISLALASEYVTKFDKVLYFNFEKIFAELERDKVGFYLMKYPEQWKLVGEKVNEIIGQLGTTHGERFTVFDLTGVNSTDTTQTDGEGSNAAADGNSANTEKETETKAA